MIDGETVSIVFNNLEKDNGLLNFSSSTSKYVWIAPDARSTILEAFKEVIVEL